VPTALKESSVVTEERRMHEAGRREVLTATVKPEADNGVTPNTWALMHPAAPDG